MAVFPVLKKGPFGLDLEKSVQYIIYFFKGTAIGIIAACLIAIIVLEVNLSSDDTTDAEGSVIKHQIVIALLVCAFCLAYFFLTGYLYKGVKERNRTWIFPWFLVTGAIGIAFIIMFFCSFVNGFGMIQLILPLVIVFQFYCILIVYSYYIDLGNNFIPDPTPPQVVPA